MKAIDGRRYDEIARRLGVSEGAARVLYHRTLKALEERSRAAKGDQD
jgi:DNA-directed RNA polymerase specialized sigma24 family protein